jgi:hypothetical protein
MDLVAQAESLLLYQFSNSPKMIGLVKSLAQPLQEVFMHLEKLHHGCYIDEAYGYSLDVIGDIVDFKRQNMSDEEYRVWLKVAILLNHCQGTAYGVLAILKVLFGDRPAIQMDEYAPNLVMFTFFEYPAVPQKILFSIIRRALPLSTKCQFVDAGSETPSHNNDTLGPKNNYKQSLPTFQLDVSRFDESVFADFFRIPAVIPPFLKGGYKALTEGQLVF